MTPFLEREGTVGNRLGDKTAIIVGAGQTAGEDIGNGRAMAILFAREGARVMLADRNLDSALETKSMIDGEGGESIALRADITSEEDCRRIAEGCVEQYGRIDVLVNNVGIGTRDSSVAKITTEAWDHILDVNLKGMLLTCKYVIPKMAKQESGSVINISSAAAICATPVIAYKVTKAGVNALTQQLAMAYAKRGVRVNAIMMGLLDTPMAIEEWKALGIGEERIREIRNGLVPLKGGQGDAWDTAYAALFLASDEAKFVTGVNLAVDGGQCAKIGT
jgi:NAD(P)-dependent dehydrogenase (short-subunit alcohol dehydrogenase family)